MMRSLVCGASCAMLASLPLVARAQGALGTQGFGYPTGQISTAALGAGGATAEMDASSPVNPSALASLTRFAVYLQFEPEFRNTSGAGFSDKSTTVRFPGFSGTFGYRRLIAGVSFSTLLDRTWSNTYSDSQLVGGTMYPSSLRAASNGAMNDGRFALSYYLNEKVQVGLGVHAISGQNRIEFGRAFPDSTGLGSVGQVSTINYSGRAVSAGVTVRPMTSLIVAASGRFGGPLNAERNEVFLSEADVPSRYGVGLSWIGIPNTVLSARYERTAWSDMRELGTDSISVFDATELGLGVEMGGPRIFGVPSIARLGFRDRTLPFGVDGERVGERSFSGGVGIPVARGRGQVDISLQRAVRNAAGVDERSWFVGIGLGIRP
jgi:hypothetical protein